MVRQPIFNRIYNELKCYSFFGKEGITIIPTIFKRDSGIWWEEKPIPRGHPTDHVKPDNGGTLKTSVTFLWIDTDTKK